MHINICFLHYLRSIIQSYIHMNVWFCDNSFANKKSSQGQKRINITLFPFFIVLITCHLFRFYVLWSIPDLSFCFLTHDWFELNFPQFSSKSLNSDFTYFYIIPTIKIPTICHPIWQSLNYKKQHRCNLSRFGQCTLPWLRAARKMLRNRILSPNS
jgi:hypothetical protein